MFDRKAFLSTFSSATRRLGADAERGRIEMLEAAASELAPSELDALVEECWRTGDNAERQAVLRALPRLPRAERFVALAVAACRTHVVPVFCAIACENAYPARHFPEASFNQMVLKALFLEVAIDRVEGLTGRVGPELVRMAAAYASERQAAGRPVSTDTHRLATWRDPS